MKCPKCGSGKVVRIGFTDDAKKEPVYECQSCGSHFTG
jgi:transposase-like protein